MQHGGNKFRKNFIIFVVAVIALMAVLSSFMYNRYSQTINQQFFDTSSESLEQTYYEVVQVFDELTESRWNYLIQVKLFLENTDAEDEAEIKNYIRSLQESYQFTEFYFLDDDGQYITVDGTTGYIDLGDSLFDLIDDGDSIVTDGSLPQRENMFFYAVPANVGVYKGFSYCAVAFGYDKTDLSAVMDISAYDGESDSYLIYPNGRVCITMGDTVYDVRNFLSLLQDIGIDADTLEAVTSDLKDGNTDTIVIELDGKEYYFSYQTTELSSWRLVSLTPVDTVDRSMNRVRQSTTSMMIGLGAVILILLGGVAIYWEMRSLRDRQTLLAEREMIFSVLSEHMDEIYFLYNERENRIMYISPNVERMLGYTPPEIYAGEDLLNNCVEDKDAWNNKSYLDSFMPGATLHKEFNMVNHITKEVRPYILDLYRPYERPELLVAALADNTREYAVRNEITAAMESARAANAAKSSFLSNMSHDIRTPMNAILGFATLLERDAKEPDAVRRHTEKIKSSSAHLLSLIDEVLDMSKIESGSMELNLKPVNIDELAEHMMNLIRPLADAKHQEITLNMKLSTNESVMADGLRLMQILQNLLSNAVKYTQDGGKIELDVSQIPDSVDKSFASFCFIVKDNGMGMSEEYLKKIFLPFSRETSSVINKVQGTGLGMAITKNLVDLMGGTIHVSSVLNEGSTFTVILEFRIVETDKSETDKSETDKSETDKSETDKALSMKGMHVLAAEDNELNMEILVELLDIEGVSCVVAENGAQAVELFEQAEPGQYDFILMDVQMPVMDGYAATRAIRASKKNPEGATIPIIAMTANAFNEDKQQASLAGMNAHLSKPMSMEELKQTVSRLMVDRDTKTED